MAPEASHQRRSFGFVPSFEQIYSACSQCGRKPGFTSLIYSITTKNLFVDDERGI